MRASGLSTAFSVLEVTRPGEKELTSSPLNGFTTPWGAASLAVDAGGHRHVLVPMPGSIRPRSDRKSAGIHVGPHTLLDGSHARTFLDLECVRPELFDIFSTIASDVLGALAEGPDRPDDVAIAVLGRWRELLARSASDFPSLSVLAGVWAELDHLITICRGRPAAVSTWRGPDRAVHDFVGPGIALEVKATTARAGWRCSIHGLDQLEPPAGGRLYLSFVRLERVEQGGTSIPEQLEALVEAGVPSADLYARVDQAGIAAAHFAEARGIRFSRLDRRVWSVQDGFPRLTRASLVDATVPPGVVGVAYELDLTAHAGSRLSDADVGALLRTLGEPAA